MALEPMSCHQSECKTIHQTSPPGLARLDSEEIMPPPGLCLQPPPGLAVPSDTMPSTQLGCCGPLPPPGLTHPLQGGQDPLLTAYQEYAQQRFQCWHLEQQRLALAQQAHFKAQLANIPTARPTSAAQIYDQIVNSPGMLEQICAKLGSDKSTPFEKAPSDRQPAGSATSSAMPVKPPGILERSDSGQSLISTADTATDSQEDAKFEHTPILPEPKEAELANGTRTWAVQRMGKGHIKVCWPVDAKKLRSKERQVISPGFEVFPGSCFKLMLKPNGETSFDKAGGHGSVSLKQVEGTAPTLRFRISVGTSTSRGPVCHNFSEGNVACLPAEEADFDFASAVQKGSSSFIVCLELQPKVWFGDDA